MPETECLQPPDSRVEILTPKVPALGAGPLGAVLSGTSALRVEATQRPLTPAATRGDAERRCLGTEPTADSKAAGAVTLDFPASGTVGSQWCCLGARPTERTETLLRRRQDFRERYRPI